VITFLNGTSSSGKTTIARELLDVLDELYFHAPVDAFHAMRARRGIPPEELPDVVLVGVRCPLPELERRERDRGDRPAGLAAHQVERVHAHGIYDLEFDTSVTAPRDCAALVRDFLPGRPAPTAFARLKAGETS
jgi:chloramphenicol 3-O phosphotransferase